MDNAPDTKTRAEELIAEISKIPVSELAECARANLKATKITRTSRGEKDADGNRKPDTVEEPDYITRQKALEWISSIIGAVPTAQRKPVKPKQAEKDTKDSGGLRRAGKGKAGDVV